MLTLIAATSTNNALGKDNQLVWHLPDDFKRFKALTSEHYIIMGRKTFESFPKPLPNRTHVIITRQSDYIAPEGCIVVSSLEEAIKVCPKNEEIFIIGGGQIYAEALQMEMADRLYITHVDASFPDAHSFFPKLNFSEWNATVISTQEKDERHGYAYKIVKYERN